MKIFHKSDETLKLRIQNLSSFPVFAGNRTKEESIMKKLILIVFLILFFLYSLRKSANFFPERIANQKFCLVGTGSLFAASLQGQRVSASASKLIRSFVQTFLKVWLPAGPTEANRLVYTPPTWWGAAPRRRQSCRQIQGQPGALVSYPEG